MTLEGTKVVLPSGVLLLLKKKMFAKSGRLAFTTNWGSGSSKFFFKKLKLSVRGVAKNAVDHINGGKGACGVRKIFNTFA